MSEAIEPLTPEELEDYEEHAQRLLAEGHEVYPDYNAVVILALVAEVRRLGVSVDFHKRGWLDLVKSYSELVDEYEDFRESVD